MLSKIGDWYYEWSMRRRRSKLPVLEWASLVDELRPIISDHSMFLETRYDGFATVESVESGEIDGDIVAVVVTLVREDLEPWETEGPAIVMAQKLSEHFRKPMPRQISRRQWNLFAGHYVRVTR